MDELCGKGTAKFGRIRTVEKLSRTRGRSTPGTTVSIFNVAPAFSSSARALPTLSPPLVSPFQASTPLLSFFLLFVDPEYPPLLLYPSSAALAHVPSPARLAIFSFPPRIQPLSLEPRQRDETAPTKYSNIFSRQIYHFSNCIYMLMFFFSFLLFYYLSFFPSLYFLVGFCRNVVETTTLELLSAKESCLRENHQASLEFAISTFFSDHLAFP